MTSHLNIVFSWSSLTQNLGSLWDARTGRELVVPAAPGRPLLELRLLEGPRQDSTVRLVDAAPFGLDPIDTPAARVMLEAHLAGDMAARVRREVEEAILLVACHWFCTLSGERLPIDALAWLTVMDPLTDNGSDEPGELLAWRVIIVNRSALKVVEVLFPRLPGLALGEHDVLIYPHHAGERIERPAMTLASDRYLAFHRAATSLQDGEYVREISYCGLASMMWMDYHDDQGGVYLASYDPDFLLTGLRLETGGPRAPYLRLALRKYLPVGPGETWVSPPYALGVHPGDWHWSARRYRAWFDTRVAQVEQPRDLAQEVVLTPHYDFRREDRIYHRFEDIAQLYDRARCDLGSRHLFIAGWNHLGFDNHYPDYNPDLELGTPMDLARGVSAVREAGGFVTFYINSRLIDVESEYYASLGSKWSIRLPDGATIEETYGPRTFSVLCPSCPEWRKYLLDFAEWMVTRYGARGIYYDQLGSATPYPCYSPHHSHGVEHHHGLFNRGYVQLLEEATSRLRSHDPDAFLMIENCGDIYSSRVWGNVTWNGELYDEFFDVYRYTFPEHTLVCMVQPRAIRDPVLQERLFRHDVGRAFLLGAVFWYEQNVFEQRWLGDGSPQSGLDWIREALAVRRAIAPTLARFQLDESNGYTFPEGMSGRVWRPRFKEEAHSSSLVLLFNPERKGGELLLPSRPGVVREVLLLTASPPPAEVGFQPHEWRVEQERRMLGEEQATVAVPRRRFVACMVRQLQPTR